MYSVIQTFTFLKYDWSRLDIIDVSGGKKVEGEREKDDRIKNFYNINYSYPGPLIGHWKKVKFRWSFRDKFTETMADFAVIFLKNLGQILPEYDH